MQRDNNGLLVTLFIAPYGKKSNVVMTNINQSEIDFFVNNELSVSMETIGTGQCVLYSTIGLADEDNEVTYIVPENESCEKSMVKLRQAVEAIWEEKSLN